MTTQGTNHEKQMNEQVQKRQLQIDKELSESGDQEAIRRRFSLPANYGGYQDVLRDPEAFNDVMHRINEKLSQDAPNSWQTYADAAHEVRAEYFGDESQLDEDYRAKPREAPADEIRIWSDEDEDKARANGLEQLRASRVNDQF